MKKIINIIKFSKHKELYEKALENPKAIFLGVQLFAISTFITKLKDVMNEKTLLGQSNNYE